MWRAALVGFVACHGPASVDETDIPGPPTGETGTHERWATINAHPCALAESGRVECWKAEAWTDIGVRAPGILEPTEPLLNLAKGGPATWGVGATTGLPVILQPHPYGPNPVPGYTEPHQNCGLLDGLLDCWDSLDVEPWEGETFVRLSGGVTFYVALTPANEIVALSNTPIGWEREALTQPVVDLMAVQPSTGCVLYASGEVECFGPDPLRFEHPPYTNVGGNGHYGCAARASGVIDCNGRELFDFGPVIDIAVSQRPAYERVFVGTPNETWSPVYPDPAVDPPHICVITATNAVRCEGFRYDFPDLQASLPSGD